MGMRVHEMHAATVHAPLVVLPAVVYLLAVGKVAPWLLMWLIAAAIYASQESRVTPAAAPPGGHAAWRSRLHHR